MPRQFVILHSLTSMRTALFYTLVALSTLLSAQQNSAVQEQSKYYSSFGARSDQFWDSLHANEGASTARLNNAQAQGGCTLEKRVFGWHPYWSGTVYNNYQWNLLSDLCYFDYAVSPTTGNNTNASYNWLTSGAVTSAINNGVDVHICATLFGSHSTFLASTAAQNTFITNIISDLQARGGKGVNIDFEGMTSGNAAPFTAFIQNLSTQLHTQIPGSELSIALYAVDWSNVFDIPNLTPYVDLFIIMGYDYYWSGSTSAGPDDPLYNFETSYNRTLTRSITFYLAQGMPTNKLLLGLPYYGREWETVGSTIPSATTGNFSASRTFSTILNNANGYYSVPRYDPVSFTPYFSFQVSTAWRQCFWENSYSMKRRYDIVNQRNLGGIGIWALGYDDGFTQYWQAIEDRFSTCAVVPCSDTIWDMGGPSRNYYDSENYTTTISPDAATSVSLTFSQFDVELNYDTLFIYDGPNATAPLIGAYTGTNSPGTVVSSGGSISYRFKSDGATTRPGFTAIWNCTSDMTQPITLVNQTPSWITQNFNCGFTDTDNGGSGVAQAFYQVADFDGYQWRANVANGFFNDDFEEGYIDPQWTVYTGVWNANNFVLEQSDENISNTSIVTPVVQNAADRYLYNWQGSISGTGNNRRAGFHFFCDSASLPNRGNGYFVWFRADQSQLEFYEVINDVFSLRASFPMTVVAGQSYDWKVIYDRIIGKIEVYQDNNFIGSWTDTTPKLTGSYVSFRSGNCKWKVDNFRVFKSRSISTPVAVTVGNMNADLRYQTLGIFPPAGVVRSLVRDSAQLMSFLGEQYLSVDWTRPEFFVHPMDGSGMDTNTTYNLTQIQGNWFAALDSNSDIVEYRYCIGTTQGDSDFVAWTSNGLNLSFTIPATLTPGVWYYIGLRSVNGAGLVSLVDTSNGQVADIGLGLSENEVALSIYPNPASTDIKLSGARMSEVTRINIYDMNGRLVLTQVNSGADAATIYVADLSAGKYVIELLGENLQVITQMIIE